MHTPVFMFSCLRLPRRLFARYCRSEAPVSDFNAVLDRRLSVGRKSETAYRLLFVGAQRIKCFFIYRSVRGAILPRFSDPYWQ